MGKEIKKCLIITGAPENDIDYYKNYTDGRFIISADSGYQKCVKLNIKPNLIIGDFDSSTKPDTDIETIVLPVRKDDTDTLAAVKEAIKRGYNDIIILGGIGNRFDHTYNNVLVLNFCFDRNIKASLINKHNKIEIIEKSYSFKKEKWYKVTDKLPDYNRNCLIILDNNLNERYGATYYKDEGFGRYDWNTNERHYYTNVTHWTPQNYEDMA